MSSERKGHPEGREGSLEGLMDVLGLHSSQLGLEQLLEIAINEGWPNTKQTVHPMGVIQDDLPRPTSLINNAWFRLRVDGSAGTNCTVDVQPLFTEGIRPTEDGPLFVNKYDGKTGISPGLHAIFEANQELELRCYEPLGNLCLESIGLSVEAVPETTTQQNFHTSRIAILNQHLPNLGRYEMPLEQALTLDAFGD